MKELEEGKVECEHMSREAVKSKKQNHYIQFNIVAQGVLCKIFTRRQKLEYVVLCVYVCM